MSAAAVIKPCVVFVQQLVYFGQPYGSFLLRVEFYQEKLLVCDIRNKGDIMVFFHFVMKRNVGFSVCIFYRCPVLVVSEFDGKR